MTLEELSVIFTADAAPFVSAVGLVQSAAGQAVQMVDSIADAFYQAGARAAEGLSRGIGSGRGSVIAAAQSLAQAAADAMRAALQIHSPSRVTREMGQLFDQGFLEGLLQDIPRVEQESRSLGIRAAAALSDIAPSPNARSVSSGENVPVHVTLPLEIDGYRLGMAVIENINRIMGTTGRVELNL